MEQLGKGADEEEVGSVEQVTVDLGESSKDKEVGSKKAIFAGDRFNKVPDIVSPVKPQLRGVKDRVSGDRIPLIPKDNIVSSKKLVSYRKGRNFFFAFSSP